MRSHPYNDELDHQVYWYCTQYSHSTVHGKWRHVLDKNERLQIFDKGLEFLSWYSNLSSKDLELEGVNLLKILDGHEFHSLLMPILIKFITIKKIIDKEKPMKIICSSYCLKWLNH